ncbi:hypothetical protein BDW59DRAFT_158512 [Aspergillus cavernicola]|uniref:Uncharacterized protein n=1 Tax=Aspergillus cavernicola TaxID=176166 RepID=A0ABR4IS61_9EURO
MASIAAKSSLFETSSSPKTSSSAQWKVTLQELKVLYIQRQYKRCVARSSSILSSARDSIHPVHKTYLYFYSGVCYEAMGQYAHDYSRNKIPLLHSAFDCFVTCLAVLPAVVPDEDTRAGDGSRGLECPSQDAGYGVSYWDVSLGEHGSRSDVEPELFRPSDVPGTAHSLSRSPSPSLSPATSASRSRSTTPAESIVSSITDFIDRTLDCPHDDPFLSDHDYDDQSGGDVGTEDNSSISVFDNDSEQVVTEDAIKKQNRLIPSPLHVRKPSKPLPLILPSLDRNTDAIAPLTTQPRQRPPSSPLPIKTTLPLGLHVRHPNHPKDIPAPTLHPAPSSSKISPHHTAAAKHYNNSITFLQTQITTSISSLQTLINKVSSLQQTRAASRRSLQRSISFWSFSPVKNSSSSSSSSASSSGSGSGSALTSGIRTKHETTQERITRLRAEGWETVGLKNGKRGWKGSAYYKEFCGMVLDELYLGV